MNRPNHPVKLTVEIELALYSSVMSKLHHGQITQIIRKVMSHLDDIISRGDAKSMHDWLYNDQPITLGESANERVRPHGEDTHT